MTINRRLVGAALVGAAAGVATGAGAAQAGPGVGSRPLRITVAAKDAPAYIKAEANYVCTGTNDQNTINAAIAEAATGPVAGSSERALNAVELSGGQYYCSGSILLQSGVDVAGAGMFASVLRAVGLTAVSGAGARVGLVKLFDTNTHGCGLHGFTLEGGGTAGGTCDGLVYSNDGASNPSGYPYTSPDPDCYAYDLFVRGFRTPGVDGAGRNGLYAETDMRGTLLHTCQVRDCSGDGIVLGGTPDSHIDRVHIGGCDGYGINVASGNNKVTNSKAYYCNIAGMRLAGSRGTFSCLEVQDSVVGFDISGTPCVAAALTADTCRDDGIILRSSTGVSLDGFQVLCRANGRYASQLRGVSFMGSPAECTIVGRVATANIGTKVLNAPGPNSFVRIAGGAMYAVG
ncbi:right-handed parallel beta-helix repeat-containing protein [Allorhizocola rhizosphaerae]|uniref:right-handed parallel beta-helix repeat-containing protein n=1 Tax=Allorhizocola rhizosphaerae TaxID=1872709 RepID=UPI000E3C8F52|nr:right-handed parallel beta-helix repeat-containing protein [Allorhizocola rhizosphaerae]